MKLGTAGFSVLAESTYKFFKIQANKQVQDADSLEEVVLTINRDHVHSTTPVEWTYEKAGKWQTLPVYLDENGDEVDLTTDYSELRLPTNYSILGPKTRLRAEMIDVDGTTYYDEISLYRLSDSSGIQIVLSNEVAQLQRNKMGEFNLADLSVSYVVYNNKTQLTEGDAENQFAVKYTYENGTIDKTGNVLTVSSMTDTYTQEQSIRLSFSVNVLGEKDTIRTAYFNIVNNSLGFKPYFSNETPVITYDEKGLTEEVDLKIGLLHSGDYAPVEAYEVEVLESNNIIATLTREASHWLYRISGMTADAADAVFKISSDNGDRLTKTVTVKRKTENVPSLTFRAKPNKLSFTYDKNKNILEPTQTISTEILYGGKDLIGSDILEDFSINASGSSSVNVARINATEFAVGMQNTELVTKDKLHGYTVSFSGHIKLKGAPQVDINYRVQLELLQSSTVADDLKQQILDEVQNRENAVDSAISAATDEAERIKGEVKAELEGLSEDPDAIKVHGKMVIDGTLGADKIVSNSITSGQIDAGSISAAILTADAVDAKVIKADEAFFEKVATSEFWSDSVNAADINAGSITTGVLKAERIEANSISLNHLSSSAFEGDGGLVTNTSMTTAIEASAEGIKLEVSQTYDPVLDSLNQEVKVTNVDVEYAENQSAVNAPESGWQSEAPTYKDGWFIWTRTTKTLGTVSKPNQSTQVIGPVCISGNTGVGVKSIQEYYFWHTTSAVAPSDSADWKTAPGAWQPNLFLWTKSVVTYTDNSTYPTDPMCVSGAPGADGSDSKTVAISGEQIFKYTNNYGSLTGPSSIVLSTTVQGITSPTYIWKVKSPDGAWTVLSDKTASLTVSPSGPYWSTHKQLTFRCELSSSVYDEISIVKVTDGSQGPQGSQGIQGPPGSNGQSQYFHVRYSANADGANMSTSPAGAIYMGTAITSTSAAPTANTAYAWSKILGDQGPQGNQGTPGQTGSDGKTPYLHIKYSDNGTSFTANNGETPGSWLGQYVDFNAVDSTVFGDYTWSKIQGVQGNQGIQGPVGPQGQSLYTWVKYADNASGGGMSDSPVGKKYIGFAYNKTVQQESTTAADYTWSLIEGPQGVQGPDGKVKYTWLKYADSPTTGMHDSPDGKKYMGVAYNKDTATESTNYADYQWSLIQGDDGADAYTLILSNENHSFAVESNGQPSGTLTATTTVTALKGATSVTPTIGAISTGITGLTATASGATVTVTMATNVTASSTSGSFSIPITVDGKSFTKTFSWSKAIKGATGQQGIAGQAAKYVTVSGEQAFKYASDASTPTPGSITLLANVNNVSGSGQWYYLTPGSTTTNVISGQTGTSLAIAHNAGYWSSHKSLTFRYLVGGVYDEITVLKLYDGATGSQGPAGSTGSTGAAGADAYSVALSNESHTFPVETNGNPSSAISTTTEIIAYKGTAAVAASSIAVAVSGAPAGITTSVNSTTKAVTVTMGTSAPTATNGTFNINVTIDGKVFAKKFSWAKAIKGNTGNTGSTGSAGVSITKVDVEYGVSSSSTAAPSSWQTTTPSWVDGQYIWSRTKTTYSSGNPTYSNPACITGGKGQTGSTGSTGAAGQSVSAISEEYYLSTSKTAQSGGSWLPTPPAWSPGKYMWTRSKITYVNPSKTEYTTPYCDASWEAIDGIEVGGRNLFLNSTDFKNPWDSGSNYTVGQLDVFGKNSAVKISGDGTLFGYVVNVAENSRFPIGEYTFTCYIKSDSPYRAEFGARGLFSNGDAGSIQYVNVTNDWQKVVINFKTLGEATVGRRVYVYNESGKTNNLYMCYPKLEKGNKATDWTPAPEDMQHEMDVAYGLNQWKRSRYDGIQLASATAYPTFNDISGRTPSAEDVLDDNTNLILNLGGVDYFIAHLRTNVYVPAAKSITLAPTSAVDDTASFFLNGIKVSDVESTQVTTLALKAGWNSIDILFYEHSGGVGFSLDKKLSDHVEKMGYAIGYVSGPSKVEVKAAVDIAADEINIGVNQTIVNNVEKQNYIAMVPSGKMLYSDETFKSDINSVQVYNNGGNSNVSRTRIVKPSDAPTNSTHAIEMKHVGAASPGLGGFVQIVNTKANAVYVQKFIAKLPVGYNLNHASNATGDDSSHYFVGPNSGTGKYETYYVVRKCGATGSFSSTGHIYVTGATPTSSAPLVWYLASATAIDVTDLVLQDWMNSTNIQLTPSEIVNTVSSGVNNGTGIVTASTTLTKDKFEVKGAAFRVVDSSGVLALNANTSGEMFLRRKMQIGGSAVDGASMANGAFEVRNDSNSKIAVIDKRGIVVNAGQFAATNVSLDSYWGAIIKTGNKISMEDGHLDLRTYWSGSGQQERRAYIHTAGTNMLQLGSINNQDALNLHFDTNTGLRVYATQKAAEVVVGGGYVAINGYRTMTYQDANGYPGMMANNDNANWIRTTQNGLIPYQSGGHGSLGTSSWPFGTLNVETINFCTGGALSGHSSIKNKLNMGSRDIVFDADDSGDIVWRHKGTENGRIWRPNSGTPSGFLFRPTVVSGVTCYLEANGKWTAYGYNTASSISLKTDPNQVNDNAVNELFNNVEIKDFYYKDNIKNINSKMVGPIIEDILPDAHSELLINDSHTGLKIDNAVWLTWRKTQLLDLETKELYGLMGSLVEENEQLKSRLDKLEELVATLLP